MSLRYLSGVVGWVLLRVLGVFLPSLPYVWYVNRRKIPDEVDGMTFDQVREEWEARLSLPDEGKRQQIGAFYQQAMSQIAGIESKATGLLSVCSIVAAGALVACTGDRLASTLGLFGLVYVACASIACAWLLVPEPRHVALLPNVLGPTDGYAEMAAATRSMEPVALRASNFVTASAYDLRRGLLVTIMALIAFTSTSSSHAESNSPTGTRSGHVPAQPSSTGDPVNSPMP